ncbi:ABC transporter permease [Bradyrhizobium sp. dw_78]|uniref:ABC transporter permease n=1 Tax=Bradyrhizobium sp. dw_78 TaxID=2719793 RepID=UPI001BD4A091|nr:ABC transporter permease [Bradyrhizobium sp. dw_78]
MAASSSRLIGRAATPLIYLVLLAAWELLADTLKVPAWILPAPSAIFQAAVKWAPELIQDGWVTLRETVGGFLLAIVLSLPLAILISLNPLARKLLYPILLGLQSVPKVAVAPLVILWFGLSEWPKIVVVVLVCFFPILVNMVAGLEAVPKTMLDLMRSLGASPHMVFRRLRLPVALPHFFTGCKVAVTFAVIGAVISEFVAAQDGLGYLILISTAQSQTPLAFAAIALLTLLSIALFHGVEFIERRVVDWTP